MTKHRTYIESDQPIEVHVNGDGRWFRMWSAVVSSGLLASLTPASVKVLLCLCHHCDGNWVCWPSVRTLSGEAGLTERAVYKAIKELEHTGVLIRRRPGGGRMSTLYQVVEPVAVDPRGVNVRSGHPCTQVQGTPALYDTLTRSIEQEPKNNSSSGPAAAAAEVAEYRRIIEALTVAEVAEPVRSRLASLPGISADLVRRVVADCRAKGKGVGAVVNGIRAAVEAKRVKGHQAQRAKAADQDKRQANQAERLEAQRYAAAVDQFCDGLTEAQAADMVASVVPTLPAFARERAGRLGLESGIVRRAVFDRFGGVVA